MALGSATAHPLQRQSQPELLSILLTALHLQNGELDPPTRTVGPPAAGAPPSREVVLLIERAHRSELLGWRGAVFLASDCLARAHRV